VDALARLFVGRPFSILSVAAVLLALHFVWRRSGPGAGRRGVPLLVSAVAWGACAAKD
jgi:hypothetical protein